MVVYKNKHEFVNLLTCAWEKLLVLRQRMQDESSSIIEQAAFPGFSVDDLILIRTTLIKLILVILTRFFHGLRKVYVLVSTADAVGTAWFFDCGVSVIIGRLLIIIITFTHKFIIV